MFEFAFINYLWVFNGSLQGIKLQFQMVIFMATFPNHHLHIFFLHQWRPIIILSNNRLLLRKGYSPLFAVLIYQSLGIRTGRDVS
jgi:hypothetical protein